MRTIKTYSKGAPFYNAFLWIWHGLINLVGPYECDAVNLEDSSRHLLIFSFSQSAICGIMTGQYSTAQCSPRPSSHRSPSFADW